MLKLCLSTALSIAVASAVLAARAEPLPEEQEGQIVRCVIQSLEVDGLPVVAHGWCVWNGKRWIPLMSDEGQARVFNIHPDPPAPIIPAPPIPKLQRRLE